MLKWCAGSQRRRLYVTVDQSNEFFKGILFQIPIWESCILILLVRLQCNGVRCSKCFLTSNVCCNITTDTSTPPTHWLQRARQHFYQRVYAAWNAVWSESLLCLCCFENRTFLHCHRPWQPDTTLIPDRLGWRQKTPLLNYLGKFRRVWYTNLSCSELELSARLKNLARINMKPSVRRHLQSWTDEEIPQGRDDNGANCLATQSRIHRQLQLWHRPFVSRETKSARQQPHNVYLVDKWDNPTSPIVRITWTLQFPLQFAKLI